MMLAQDLRFAARSLSKSRLFAVVAVASLALGIGATTTVFSLVNAIVFKPLPFRDAGQLVDVHEISATHLCAGCEVGTSYSGFLDWRARARSFVGMETYTEVPFAISGGEGAERVGGALVSAGLFPLLGISPLRGRTFTPDEDRPDAPRVVLLSEGLWRRRFGGDSSVVGRTVRVNGLLHTIIGVMPPRFRYPEFADLWVAAAPVATLGARADRSFGVVARLRDGVTIAQARSEMESVARSLETEHPETQREWSAGVTSLRRDVAGTEATIFGVMLGAVAFVLLIVCANIAGLLLARGSARRKEIAIRLALGASRSQLVRQLLAESLLLALSGGLLGALLAWWGVDLAVAGIGTELPWWLQPTLDVTVLAFALLLSVGTGVMFGLAPALRASRPDVHVLLKDGGYNASIGVHRSRLRGALVIGELAMALVLLAGAGVLVKSLLRVSARTVTYDPRRVLTANAELLDARYADERQVAGVMSQVLERVLAIPGVRAATLQHTSFIAGFGGADQRIRAEGVQAVPDGVSPRFAHAVTSGYFSVFERPLRSGRLFTSNDRAGSERVVVVNEGLARALWPSESALGKRIKLGGDSLPWLTIVGTLADEPAPAGGRRPGNQAYVSFAQQPGRPATILLSTSGDALAAVPALRAAVHGVDPDLPLVNVRTLEQEHRSNFWPYRMYATVMSGFALLAIVLAAMGVYGVVAYSVTQRTREIGVRVALGAEPRHVLRLVTGQGARLAVAGIVIGVAGSAVLLRVLQFMLFGASPIDPVVFIGVSGVLACTALLASYLPARRAARVDPLVALRSE